MNAENPKKPLPNAPKVLDFTLFRDATLLKNFLNQDQKALMVPLFAIRTANSLGIYQAQEAGWGHAG